jgi:LuxR family transcriptional regulator, maltose regulon positive regulatory protein
MASELLATKLRIPPRTHLLVRRARLIDALEEAVPCHKLTLVAAPAGYGKTTLLADWARSTSLPVAWLSLGEEDNDVARFFRYLLSAWEREWPGIGESRLGLLLEAKEPNPDAILTAFTNVASDLPDPMVFVLDDIHLIDDPAIYEALAFLLDHLPPGVHFVLAGRDEPPLPLARYRARQEQFDIDTADLQFQLEETEAFLNDEMRLDLAGDRIASLHGQLEGWIAGTQMVALTLRRSDRPVEDIVISGRHRFIADYLSEDVLAQLSDDIRRFMLRTSILDRFSSPLCDAVTGGHEGQAMLEEIEREHLFVVPLDDNREWYRYHRLFAEFMQAELQRGYPDEVADLHCRAARWYLTSDLSEPAFQHAVAANDPELAVQIVDRYYLIQLHGGELNVLRAWIDAVPAEWHVTYPQFDLIRSALLAMEGKVADCIRCLDDVEGRLTPPETDEMRWQLARVASYRCFIACFRNDLVSAEALADQALRELRADDIGARASIYHALGDTYSRNGRWEDARQAYLKVLEYGRHYAGQMQAAHVFGALADLELRQGRLQVAAAYWRKGLDAVQSPANWGRLPAPVIGWVYVRMGELLYERNDLAGAWDHVSRGLERAEAGGDIRTTIAGCLFAGRIRLTEGDIDAATAYLERARPLVDATSFPEWTSRFERLQLELWLATDRLRAAVNWSDSMLAGDVLRERPEPEVAQLATARALIVKGDNQSIDRALGLLSPLLRVAEAGGRAGIQIEGLALQALAHWQRGDRPAALTALEQALRLAEPEDYQRLFADYGLPMARILQEARSREILPVYVDRLLDACGATGRERPFLAEPLTEREQEILELIAAGLTNREIADRLSIAVETVKKHTGNIYGKLAARGRTEAVARGRELALLR